MTTAPEPLPSEAVPTGAGATGAAPTGAAPTGAAPTFDSPVEPPPGIRDGAEPTRADRILDAFGDRAAANGIRAVVMSDLARELAMSTKTLYREFPTKDALVQSLVGRWARDFVAVHRQRQQAGMPAEERLRLRAREIVRARRKYSEAFWDDLNADHPDAWRLYTTAVLSVREEARARIEAEMREGVDKELAWQLVTAMVETALQSEVRARTGMTVEQSIDAAIELWARGALR